ncbi:MAG: hypothetical protein ACT4TC_18860 [Myxococcaceae bacterium]
MPGQTCRRVVISSNDCAEVSRCDCGHLHVSVGPLTLRLEDSVMDSLLSALMRAREVLDSAGAIYCDDTLRASKLKQ